MLPCTPEVSLQFQNQTIMYLLQIFKAMRYAGFMVPKFYLSSVHFRSSRRIHRGDFIRTFYTVLMSIT